TQLGGQAPGRRLRRSSRPLLASEAPSMVPTSRRLRCKLRMALKSSDRRATAELLIATIEAAIARAGVGTTARAANCWRRRSRCLQRKGQSFRCSVPSAARLPSARKVVSGSDQDFWLDCPSHRGIRLAEAPNGCCKYRGGSFYMLALPRRFCGPHNSELQQAHRCSFDQAQAAP